MSLRKKQQHKYQCIFFSLLAEISLVGQKIGQNLYVHRCIIVAKFAPLNTPPCLWAALQCSENVPELCSPRTVPADMRPENQGMQQSRHVLRYRKNKRSLHLFHPGKFRD